MRRPLFPIPISILLFLAATFAGTYYVRRGMLERAMVNAMEIEDAGMMRQLLEYRPAPVDVIYEDGSTPLHEAAKLGDLRLAGALLAKGARIDAVTNHRGTPLHVAVTQLQVDMLAFLIERGADVNAAPDWAATPLHWAKGRLAAFEAALRPDADGPSNPPPTEVPKYYGKATAENARKARLIVDLLLKHGARE